MAEYGREQRNQLGRAITNTEVQKKSNGKQNFGFVDNRPEAVVQKKLEGLVSHDPRIIQLQTVTVKNRRNFFDSGWRQYETRSTGVERGPRREAQAVQEIAGGYWVGGHMVNDRLGGSGGFENIVPITSTMNNKHHTIENSAQRALKSRKPTEVRYYMQILRRNDYIWPNGDRVNNLPDMFRQSYDYRTRAVPARGTRSRRQPRQPAGRIKTVRGKILTMKV